MEQANELPDKKLSSIAGHLSELRRRLLFSFIIFIVIFAGCYIYSQEVYMFLVSPLAEIYIGNEEKRLIYTGLTEAFLTYVKVSFYAAIFLSFPIFASQIYLFLAPGLYKKEKRVILPFLVSVPILFLAGAAVAYYLIFPVAWQFFTGFEDNVKVGGLPITLEARVSEYLSLVISLIFAFGISFQLPIVLTLLYKAGIIQIESLKKKRKYAVIIILFAAAMLTPPDVFSQIALFIPLYMLYELSIILCKGIK